MTKIREEYITRDARNYMWGKPWYCVCVIEGKTVRSRRCEFVSGHEICSEIRSEILFLQNVGHSSRARSVKKPKPRILDVEERRERRKAAYRKSGNYKGSSSPKSEPIITQQTRDILLEAGISPDIVAKL